MSDGDGLHIWEKLNLTLDGIGKHMKRMDAVWLQRATDEHRNFFTRGSGICTGTTFDFSIGGPQAGRVHDLRGIRVGGPLITSSPTYTAIYIMVSPTDPVVSGALDTSSMVDNTTLTLPQVAFYGTGEISVRHPDKVWVVVVGGSNNQQFVANARWEDYKDGGYGGVVEL